MHVERQRWWGRRWVLWTVAVFLLVAIAAAMAVEWGLRQIQPMLRKKVVETLSARFHCPVELDRFGFDEQGFHCDGWRAACSLPGGTNEAGCEAECAADVGG